MTTPPLARRLGTRDAVVIGLSSMIGAGVFAVFAPAAQAAGSWLLVGLAVAAVVAYANASSSAQLAAQYPTSGGTYVYGRERLGPWWGFVAGWGFVIGKTASCAAMALTFAYYAAPHGWERPVAVLAVVLIAGVNYRGVTRTARLARVLVAVVLVALTAVVMVGLVGEPDGIRGVRAAVLPPLVDGADGDPWFGVLQAAGLLFFAFAGYARVATLGEEVKDPARTIPRAIRVAFVLVLGVYAAVAVTLLSTLGADGTAAAAAPLAAVADATGLPWLGPLVTVGAAAGSLGALLALVAGVGRTALAMARAGDLPRPWAAVHPRFAVPHRAEVAVAVVVVGLVLTVDLRDAIGFSSFGVLTYYLVANLAAWTQRGVHRRSPRTVQGLGAAGCAVLVVTLPTGAVLGGLVVLAVGVTGRMLFARAAR